MGLVSSLTKSQQKALKSRLRAAGRTQATLADIAIVTGANLPKPQRGATESNPPSARLSEIREEHQQGVGTVEGVGLALLEGDDIVSLTLRPGLVAGAFTWTLRRRVEGQRHQYMHGRIVALEYLYDAVGAAHLAGNWRKDKFGDR